MFLLPEPWTEQYFAPVNRLTDRIIPIDDTTAYDMCPQHNWVYNKMNLCISQNIPHGPEGTRWTVYPVVSKPAINLWGMSVGVNLLNMTWEQFYKDNKHYRAGNFWMPFFEGRHFSTDFVLVNGIVKWHATLEGHKYKDIGTFSYWEIVDLPRHIREYVTDWLRENIGVYTGIINIESINENIIECHLRLSPQFVDLYCPTTAWLTAVSHLYDNHVWYYALPPPQKGYSVVLWTEQPGVYQIDNKTLNIIKRLTESVQFTFTSQNVEQEAGNGKQFRLAVVNGWTLEMCNKSIDLIRQNIKRVG